MQLFKKVSPLLFILLLLNISASTTASFVNINVNDWIEYSVKNSSNSTNGFYGSWPPGLFYGNWSVENGDKIRFQVDSIDSFNINGTLILGSVIFENVRNIDVASALALSIYPWNGGLFANSSDWRAIVALVEDTNTTISSQKNYFHRINETDSFFSIQKFETLNYYGQNSVFTYDFHSGVLLSARTSFGDYLLEISLENTSIKIGSTTQTLVSPMMLSFILVISIISFYKVYQFRKSRSNNDTIITYIRESSHNNY